MTRKLTVIKLGGSILTDKSIPYKSNDEIIASIAKELKDCIDSGLIEDLIIVHGVGSFGHVPVFKHNLHLGFQHPDQLFAMSKTQHEINEFRLKLTAKFIENHLPVNLLHASSFCVQEKMKITDFFLQAVKGYISIGMIPLVGGDMLYDSKMGFSVGSGDQFMVLFAKQFSANQVIYVSDVDGVYTSDPKQNPEAKLIDTISISELGNIVENTDEAPVGDVSGAMKGKLKAILSLKDEITKGTKVILMSMTKYGNLKSILGMGTTIKHTEFVK
ncbi:MAG: amino acid kinase [Promethearchaeota archaeon]|nr:MAG: amino acid kinase [Candidatus Lokiarchaeota archaeon]